MAQPTETAGGSGDLAVLLFRLARALKQVTAGDPVEGPALAVLHQLGCSGPSRLSDLAAQLGLDASTVSRHVRSLEMGGYVARTDDPADRRAALLAATAPGRHARDAALARRRALLDATLADWSPADRQALTTLLGRLADDLVTTSPSRPLQETV